MRRADIGGAILRFGPFASRSLHHARPSTNPLPMTIATLYPLHHAPVAGSLPARVSGRAPIGARVGGVSVVGKLGLEGFDGRIMQDVRGFRPRLNTIGAGVGLGGRTLTE
jgi:hypothetical protein